jgi:hypothetical protein
MTEYKKIENEASLVKDMTSGAIISTDKNAFNNYINNRDKKLLESKRLDNLENELSDIKKLLLKLLDK